MPRKRTTYAKNKMGLSARGVANDIVESITNFSKTFVATKGEFNIIDRSCPVVDVDDKQHTLLLQIHIDRKTKKGGKFEINGQFGGGIIRIMIHFDPTITRLSTDEWNHFAYDLRFVLYHELGHAKRGPQIRRKQISTKPPKIKRHYPRTPLELDANISAIVDIMRDIVEDYKFGKYPIKANTHLFFSIMQNFPMFQKAYSTPKWRKIIIKRLHREGIDIK